MPEQAQARHPRHVDRRQAAAVLAEPDTLAALARANTPVEALPADAQRGAAAVRITAWRSTTGLAPSAAGLSAAQALSSGSPAHASMSHAAFAQATMARNIGTDAISALAPPPS